MEKNIGKQNSERKRARFSKEFKLEAVRLLELGQEPATQLALELGIARNQLYKWQAQLVRSAKSRPFMAPDASQKMSAARMSDCVQNSNE